MSNLLIRDVMVRTCNDYYMIDAMAGGEVIRKRKYRRENTMIGYKWYDYNGVEVIDPIEITQALEQEGPKVDLSPYYTKDEINNIVNDINQKIEDKSTSIIFDTYIQMKSFVDDPTNADKLKEGTILLIREKNVPDYYYDGAGMVKMEV